MLDAMNRVDGPIYGSARRTPLLAAELRDTTSPLSLRIAQGALQAQADVVEPSRTRTTYHRIERVGQPTSGAAADPLLRHDDRTYSDISTVESQFNIVEPLFASSLVPSGPQNYRERLFQLIDEASKFIFLEGYQLGDEALVEKLIDKAKAGVQVTVLFDPVNPPEEQRKAELLNKLRDAAQNDPAIRAANSLHVAEFKTVRDEPEVEDQILHIKRTMADRPNGAIGEVSGGINFGDDSHLNVDTGWYTEGVSVLDSLQKMIDHWPREGKPLPFDLSMVPTVPEMRELMRARESELVTVEIAGSGKRRVESPRQYTMQKLQERATLGRKIVIDAKELFDEAVLRTVIQARQNGSEVRVIAGEMTDAEKEQLKAVKRELKTVDVPVLPENAVLRMESYPKLLHRELDAAIANQESIDIGSFALTEIDVLYKLVEAHRAGCKVRVLVDDLEIGGHLINKKAIAMLTGVGVEIKGFTEQTAEDLDLHGREEKPDLKLHSKICIIGGNRVLGGSANFSNNAFTNNVEDGRLVRSETVATAFTDVLFDPLWDKGLELAKLETIHESNRVSITERVTVDTKAEDLVFVVFDLETTGFSAHYDDRVVSLAAKAMRMKPDGSTEVIGEFNEYVDPGTNAFGKTFKVPWQAAKVHGLTNERLAELGARTIREVLPDFIQFLRKAQEEGEVVLAGHNVGRFDLRFLDVVLGRKVLGQDVDGETTHFKIDAPYVDSLFISRKLFPDERAHDLDTLSQRLGLATEDRAEHDAAEDVAMTGDAIIEMISRARDQFKTLGDMLGPDLLQISEPIFGSGTPGGPVRYQLEKPEGKKLVLQKKERDGSYSDAKRVLDLQVVGRAGDHVEVNAVVGTARNNEELTFYLPLDGLEFRSDGILYHQLREDGVDIPRPEILQSLAKW